MYYVIREGAADSTMSTTPARRFLQKWRSQQSESIRHWYISTLTMPVIQSTDERMGGVEVAMSRSGDEPGTSQMFPESSFIGLGKLAHCKSASEWGT